MNGKFFTKPHQLHINLKRIMKVNLSGTIKISKNAQVHKEGGESGVVVWRDEDVCELVELFLREVRTMLQLPQSACVRLKLVSVRRTEPAIGCASFTCPARRTSNAGMYEGMLYGAASTHARRHNTPACRGRVVYARE